MDVCVVKVMGASAPVASSSSSRPFPRSATSSRAGDDGAGDGSSSSSSSSSSSLRRAIERGFGTEEGGAETTRGVRIDSDLDLDWIRIFSLSRVGAIA